MLSLMAEIVVKEAPPPIKLRPTQKRPASAVQARPMVTGLPRPSSACNLPGATSTAGAADAANTSVPVLRPGQVPRPFNSMPPPDHSVRPAKGGFFERLTAEEAADRLDGIAGTTLPGAQALQAIREQAYVAAEVAREERAEAARARVQAARDERAATQTRVPKSQNKFAWGAERIAEQLLVKMDTFTARDEDHTRKMLWTLGTDPQFKVGSRNALRMTPQNFPRVADRFGIACTEQQARKIFQMQGLPESGCSLHTLTSKFNSSPVDMANIVRDQARRIHGDAARPAAAVRPRTPKAVVTPFKNAHLTADAWAHYHAEVGAADAIGGAWREHRSSS